jgi:Thioredoxin domain-containing protein
MARKYKPSNHVRADEPTAKEKFLTGIIFVLVAIIFVGIVFFSSELSECKTGTGGSSGNETETNSKAHNSITTEEYMALLKSGKDHVVFIGRPTCGYSVQQDPILKEIAAEYNIVINYLNIDEQAQSSMAEVLTTYESFTDGRGVSTPTVVIIKNNVVNDAVEGLHNKEQMVNFLEEVGIIK